jgi:hypothetical protein
VWLLDIVDDGNYGSWIKGPVLKRKGSLNPRKELRMLAEPYK